jgi:HK97 family phage portal protein
MPTMTFKERLYLMRKALQGTFDLPADSVGLNLLKGLYPSAGGEPPLRTTRATLDGYNTMPWLRAVTSKVGYAVASTRWCLYVKNKKTSGTGPLKPVRDMTLQRAMGPERFALMRNARLNGELKEIEDHPLLDFLNDGNTIFKGFNVRRLLQISLDLVGEAFLIKERNPLGAPVRSWPIPAHWVTDTPVPSHPFYSISYKGLQGEIPESEMLYLRDPNPVHPYGRGSGTAMVLADELETEEYATKHIKAFFYNRARPDFIVYPKADGVSSTLQREEVLRVEKDWSDKTQGFWRAFRPYFMTREVGIHEFEQNFQHLQLIELKQHERDTIVQVFGFPPELLGIIENSNRATIEAAEMYFAKWALTPRLEFLRTELQARLVPEYDDRLILEYESPIQEDKEFSLKVMQAQPKAFSINEWRELAHKDPLDGDEGEQFMGPLNVEVVETLEEAEEPDPLMMEPGAFPLPGKPKPQLVAPGDRST